MSNTFDKICDIENIEKAYHKSRKGKSKYKNQAIKFAKNEIYNIKTLRQILLDETYTFGTYYNFKIFEPKERDINAPQYVDKIVQLATCEVLKEIYYPTFIYDSYSCIENKGTHRCVERIYTFMRKAKWLYGDEATIVKIDIKKFFYSIDRDILKQLLTKKIKCKKTLKLLYLIIDSANQIDEKGLPLGNTTSQLFINIYMNEIDQYIKRYLGIKFYVRYSDDIVIIVENKDKAREVFNSISVAISEKLNLNINKKKSKIFNINQGVNAIGFKIYSTHMLLRDDSKRRIKRKLKKFKRLLIERKISQLKVEQILNSWYGHAKQCNCKNFVDLLLERNDYIYLKTSGKKSVFKVNIKEINKCIEQNKLIKQEV